MIALRRDDTVWLDLTDCGYGKTRLRVVGLGDGNRVHCVNRWGVQITVPAGLLARRDDD